MEKISNRIITQVGLLLLILLLLILAGKNLSYFIPGFLGAITLYILFRNFYNRLVYEKHWKPWLASIFIIVVVLVSVAIPTWIIVQVLIPQIDSLMKNTPVIIEKFNAVKAFMAKKPILKNINLSEDALMNQLQKVATYIPKFLNSIASIFANIATAFFILYFMQINSRNMERRIAVFLPFSQENVDNIWSETRMMVRANALGIPILAICQGIVAVIGYWFFGVNNFFLWGMLTGAASIIPVLGTMVIWVPICIIVFASGEIGRGIGLTLYCLIAVGGIDNVLRFTILKKIGDVHPLITVFGVILGLNLFGMMGLIFGPLLVSYLILLMKVYRTEFGRKQELIAKIEEKAVEQKACEEEDDTGGHKNIEKKAGEVNAEVKENIKQVSRDKKNN